MCALALSFSLSFSVCLSFSLDRHILVAVLLGWGNNETQRPSSSFGKTGFFFGMVVEKERERERKEKKERKRERERERERESKVLQRDALCCFRLFLPCF